MNERRNPVMAFKIDNGYTWNSLSQVSGIHPQTLQYLANKNVELMSQNIAFSLYLKLRNNLGIDLAEYINQ